MPQPGAANPASTPAADTAKATASSYAAKKSDFVHIMRAQLDEANNEINALDSQITTATKQDKEMTQPKIDVLRGQAQNIKVQLNNADNISETGWDTFTEQVDKAYADLKDATAETRLWLNNYLINHKSI
jgi:hypothetical protein